jgi:hypothetical protein
MSARVLSAYGGANIARHHRAKRIFIVVTKLDDAAVDKQLKGAPKHPQQGRPGATRLDPGSRHALQTGVIGVDVAMSGRRSTN